MVYDQLYNSPVFLYLYVYVSVDYPDLCNCTCDGTEITCDDGGLTYVPLVPQNTTHLTINNFIITSLDVFPSYPSMILLDLVNNRIRYIEKDAFAELPKLKYLSLRKNDIDFGDLPNMLFDHLRELFSLDISENNMWRTLNKHYRDDILENVTSLHHLKMDSLQNATIGLGFSGLTNLTHLTFRAKMKYIWNDTFANLRALPITHLSINSGWLKSIDSMALSHFPLLHTLDLSYNPLLGFTNAANGWPGLQYTSVKELIFQYSTPYDTSIITMEENFFEGLQYTNLTKFAVDGNQIITMPGVFTKYIPKITYLSLSYNRLTQVAEIIADIGKLEHLVYVDASYQSVRSNITGIEVLLRTEGPTTFYSKSAASKSYHNARYNDANNVRYDDDDVATAVEKGDVSALCPRNNDTDTFSITLNDETSPMPWGFYVPFTIPRTTQVLKLASSLSIVTTVFPMMCLFNTYNIRYFDYSGNVVSRFEYPLVIVDDSVHPITANFRSNGITYISNNTLIHGSAVSRCMETLLLGDNKLGPSLEQTGLSHLAALYVLTKLDITANGIRHLQHDALNYLPQLEVLELDINSLRDVSFDLHFLENLTYLGLSHNLLSSIGDTTRDTLDVIANTNGKLSLALAGNPFICSCDTLDFLKWAIELDPGRNGSLQIIDFGEVVCTFDKNSNASFAESLDDIIKQLNIDCNIIKYIVITVVSAAVITIVVGLSIFARRHRWDIRFWFLNLTMRRKRRAAIADELREIYRYDAFVSYHDDSVGWIKSDMIPSLEKCDDPLKLCLHDRDFIAGNDIDENIMKSIHNSRKTVLLINRDFINSKWCKFETEMAHLESLTKGRDIVIAILLEPASVLLKHPTMYQTLRTLLRKRTYIEWPRNRLHQDMFWEKIYQAIRNPIMRPLQCVCGRALDRTFSRLISTDDASRDDDDAEAPGSPVTPYPILDYPEAYPEHRYKHSECSGVIRYCHTPFHVTSLPNSETPIRIDDPLNNSSMYARHWSEKDNEMGF